MVFADALDRVGAVWDGNAIDAVALERYYHTHLAGFQGPLELAQFHGGASNPTFLLTDHKSGKRYALRKQPAGTLIASAHAVDREFRVMQALGTTDVTVPNVLAFCKHAVVIGTPFYLMPFIEARIYKNNHFLI